MVDKNDNEVDNIIMLSNDICKAVLDGLFFQCYGLWICEMCFPTKNRMFYVSKVPQYQSPAMYFFLCGTQHARGI